MLNGYSQQFATKKKEKVEQYQVRYKKENENIRLDVVEGIYSSPHITSTLGAAVRCLEDDGLRPWRITEFTNLRDVLLTTLLITSLRRAMEFAEFRLGEFSDASVKKHKDSGAIDYVVIRVANHKTAEKGPSLLYLNPKEYAALTAYIKYY